MQHNPAMSFPRRSMPDLALVEQRLNSDHIADVRGETSRRLAQSGWLHDIRQGAHIAITAGSRSIGGLVDLLAGIIDAVKEAGGEPFIIPAMGSHGGATAEGQTEILNRSGVNSQAVGVPILSTMHTRSLGTCETGAVAHLGEIASTADGIIVLARVKTHPENSAGVASGLLKMVTVGLGKQAGAQEAHSHGLWESVRSVSKLTMARSRILCGVSVVENAFRQPMEIEVVPPYYDAFLDSDERLLEVAKPHVARIPFQKLDLLITDELGKSISGTGMDLNVIGRWRLAGGPRDPDYRRIVALSLTHQSLGNGLGIGLADFTTRRFVEEFDEAVTYVNLLTAVEPGGMNTREGVLPLALPSDREAIEVALYSSLAGPHPRICRIRNTASLDQFWVSEALLEEVDQKDSLTVLAPPAPVNFDQSGNLF
jgi:hypothetical protein